MIEIIPAINADNFEEIQRRLKLIEPYADWVQLDAADGTFTKNTIWHNSEDLAAIDTKLKIEVHLMVDAVEKRIQQWLLPNVKRIIFHLGATKDHEFVISECKKAGKEVGIAVAPSESIFKALSCNNKTDVIQILAVNPGLPGQTAQKDAFERIKEVRNFCKSCRIEVDGGMNKETAKKAVAAGADIIVSASEIFKDDNVEKNIKDFYGALNR